MKFRMVDQILAWTPHREIRGVKAVSFEEYRMRAALGQAAGLPQTLVLESFVQLAGWLTILSSGFEEIAAPVGVEAVEFRAPLGPGRRMVMEVRVREWAIDLLVVDAIGRDGATVIATVTGLQMQRLPLTQFHDPDDLRVLFSEIRRDLVAEAR